MAALPFVTKGSPRLCCLRHPVIYSLFDHGSHLIARFDALHDVLRAFYEHLPNMRSPAIRSRLQRIGPRIRRKFQRAQPHFALNRPRQAAIKRARRKRGDALGLDLLVERGVVMLEHLVVREVARTRPSEDRADDARILSPDARCRLDVFGGILGLTVGDHQAQTIHVHADGEHVCRKDDVNGSCIALLPLLLELDFKLRELLRNVSAAHARGQFVDHRDTPLRESRTRHAAVHRHAIATGLHIVLGKTAHPSEFTQRVEVADGCHVRVGQPAKAAQERLSRREERHVRSDERGRS